MSTLLRSKERVVSDAAKQWLENALPGATPLLEQMTSGDIFEQWVDMTVQEMSTLNGMGYSERYLAQFLQEATRQYALSYIRAMGGVGDESV